MRGMDDLDAWRGLVERTQEKRRARVTEMVAEACAMCRKGMAHGFWESKKKGAKAKKPSAIADVDETGQNVRFQMGLTWRGIVHASPTELRTLATLVWRPVDPKHPLELLAETAE